MLDKKELRDLRIVLGFRQSEIAEAIGLSRPHYCRMETGAWPLSRKYHDKALHAMGVETEEEARRLLDVLREIRSGRTLREVNR